MSATNQNKILPGLFGYLAVAALLLVLAPAVAGAGEVERLWQDPNRVATSVEIDDDAIVIHTESKDGGDPETIEIVAEGGDEVVIFRDKDDKKWKKKWKKKWREHWEDWEEDCEHGERVHINWDWSDLDDFDFDDYDDCDRDAIVHFGSDIYVEKGEHVEGDVVAIGGSVYIEGEVDGDVVAVGGSVTLGRRAEVDGDVVAVAGDLELHRGCEIDGDAVSVGGDIDDDGARIHGDTVLIEFDLW
jgi:hypothetical protein